MEGTLKKTYQIVKKFAKSGIIRKITLGIATVVIVLILTFASGPAEAVEPINPTPMPIERVHPGNPGVRAKSDFRNEKGGKGVFAEAWVQNPYQRSGPGAANRLAKKLNPGQVEGRSVNGLSGRFSARPTPDPYNPGCAGGPRSITVLSSQENSEHANLTKEQIRNLPDKRDGFITEENHPPLVARYGQVEFKTPKHGGIHGLPTNEKGQTPKTEENALALRDSLVNMPNREDIQWFDNGMYQGGTERGYDSVNIYDQKTGVIAVYKKLQSEEPQYARFATTCKLTDLEKKHFLESDGNFVTENVLKNQRGVSNDDL